MLFRSHKLGGVSLYMQPVQDLTIEDRVARTQYQFTVEDPDPTVLAEWVPKLVERLQREPELRDVASDQQNNGLRAFVEIDRDAGNALTALFLNFYPAVAEQEDLRAVKITTDA